METGANVTYHPVINFEGNYIMLDCFNPAHFKTYECFRVSSMSVISLIAFVCGLYMFLQTVCCCRGRRNLSGEATPRKPVVSGAYRSPRVESGMGFAGINNTSSNKGVSVGGGGGNSGGGGGRLCTFRGRMWAQQPIVFFLATIQGLVGLSHWVFWRPTAADYIMLYLQVMMLAIVYYNFLLLVINVFKKGEGDAWRKLLMVGFFLLWAGVTVFFVLAELDLFNSVADCHTYTWLFFYAVIFVLIIAYFMATRAINRVLKTKAIDGVVRSIDRKRRKMNRLAGSYVFTSAVSLGYTIYFFAVGDSSICINEYNRLGYALLYIPIRTIQVFVPTWILLLQFRRSETLPSSARAALSTPAKGSPRHGRHGGGDPERASLLRTPEGRPKVSVSATL